ncbi:hypothetical protein M8J75_016178 [Diaphorina citri]|nr:hypothetical protein M8J75_016178 [Diaphorina citri]
MAQYNINSHDYKLINYNNNNNVKRKESIHSGHFMISQFEVDDEEDEIMPQVPQDDIKMVIEPATIVPYTRPSTIMPRRSRVKSSVIETSLTKLFECMSLAYRQKLTSPKWNRFKGIRLRWKDKIRLNNVIWRCWYMQFVIKKNALVCQFASPLDSDTHNKPEAVVLEGKYWKRKLHAVTAEYKKWRQFFHLADMLEWQPGSNESNSTGSMLLDEDYMEFMSDTLFSTLSSQSFFFPDSKELSRVASIADFIQPSLVQLQPNLDDLMEGFEPFHELLSSKLPTVPEEQFATSPSTSSLPSHFSTSPKPSGHQPNQNPSVVTAQNTKSDYLSPNATSLDGKDYATLSGGISNTLGKDYTNLPPLAGNLSNSLTGNVLIKPDYLSQSANLRKSDYNIKQEPVTSQPLHHPNIIYSGARTSGSTLMTLANNKPTGGKSVDGGYNFNLQGDEKATVFSYAPAASSTAKSVPPPAYTYSSAPTSLKSPTDNYPTSAPGYEDKSDPSMYVSFDSKPSIVQYNYGKSVQYISYGKENPYKGGGNMSQSYSKEEGLNQDYSKVEDLNQAYDKVSQTYDKVGARLSQAYSKGDTSLNQTYNKVPGSELNQAYSKGSANLNQGYSKVQSSDLQGYDKGTSSLNQGYEKVGASLNQGYDNKANVNMGTYANQQQYASYPSQYMQDVRNEYNTNTGSAYSAQQQSQLSYHSTGGVVNTQQQDYAPPSAQYNSHHSRQTTPTSSSGYPYYREPSPYQQAIDFKLPTGTAGGSTSSGSAPYPTSRRSSLVQPPPQSPESAGPGPNSPGNMRRPGSATEEYALPPKPQVLKMRHRTRSSCNIVNPRYFLNTATDPNLVHHHNSALLAQLLTSNSHTSYGGLPKASAVYTGETISCPGYTGRSRTPDSVYVPPPQEQVLPPAPPSYPPYPPKSAFLVSSQSEGSLFNLINSRAANFSQNSVLQRQTKIIQEKNQQHAAQRNNSSSTYTSTQTQSQYMSGASSSSSLAPTSPSPSSKPPDSPEPLSPSTPHPAPPPSGVSPPHTSGSGHRPSPYKEHRRVCHINAEQKRRCNIKNGFDTLHLLIPHLSHNPNTKMSKAAMLQKGAEYIKQLRSERSQLKEEMEALRLQVESLNAQISNSQSLLPATGAPVSRHRVTRMREMFDAYVASRTRDNWKFWLLSLICGPLLDSYSAAVSSVSMQEMYRTTLAWSEQHCSLGNLRPIVLSALRYLSTETEILSDPSLLPDEALRAVSRPG